MERNYRRHTQIFFITLVSLGTTIIAAAIVVFVRTAPIINRLLSISSGGSAECGCHLSAPAVPTSAIISGSALLVVSGAVVLLTLVRALLLVHRTRRFVLSQNIYPPSAPVRGVARQLKLADRVHEVDSLRAEVFCAGLLKPNIYVSTSALATLQSGELYAVMAHERRHLSQRDPWRIFLVDVLTFAWRWMPGTRNVVTDYRDSLELAADESVLATSGSLHRLGRALLKLLAVSQPHNLTAPAPVTFFGTNERRIDQLLGQTVVRPRWRWMLVMMVIGFGFIMAASSASARVGAAAARVEQVTSGQCREMRPACTAPVRSWVPAMSHIELVSSE